MFEEVKLPKDATLVPGVIGHYTDFIEHPDLIAQRLVRYAKLVGRENVLAGTDCGIGTRVGHPSICWAKFEAMAEGAAARRSNCGAEATVVSPKDSPRLLRAAEGRIVPGLRAREP